MPVDKKWLHAEPTGTGDRPRAARMLCPIVFVKEVEACGDDQAYRRVHVSFQSTGPTNISTVNALDAVMFMKHAKERGRGAQKRVWEIEMNEARLLYLRTYGKIDTADWVILMMDENYIVKTVAGRA